MACAIDEPFTIGLLSISPLNRCTVEGFSGAFLQKKAVWKGYTQKKGYTFPGLCVLYIFTNVVKLGCGCMCVVHVALPRRRTFCCGFYIIYNRDIYTLCVFAVDSFI